MKYLHQRYSALAPLEKNVDAAMRDGTVLRADRCRPDGDVRGRILEDCLEGGGFALGLGNWVADPVPLDNYLAMVRAAREYV